LVLKSYELQINGARSLSSAENCHITGLGRRFLCNVDKFTSRAKLLQGEGFEGEGLENVGETEKISDLESQALAPFAKSFTKRYEQWKRADLAVIALETLPKQVKKDKVLDNLMKLYHERAKSLREET
jgi:hypothetical protein